MLWNREYNPKARLIMKIVTTIFSDTFSRYVSGRNGTRTSTKNETMAEIKKIGTLALITGC